jgi:hypothetical protein
MKKLIIKFVEYAQFVVTYMLSVSNPSLRANYQQLRSYRNRFIKKRCFIMGNGPSLNETPLEKLEGEYVWGLNRCHLLFDRISWRPKFITAVDDVVIPDIADEIQDVITTYPDIPFFFPEEFYRKAVLEPNSNVIWFRQRPMEPSKDAQGFFSYNAGRYLRVPHTVSITALQLAVYMGFNPIYLIGCDTSYTIPEDVDAEGTTFDPASGEKIDGYVITSKTNNDPNHFTPEYFGSGSRWHHPNVKGMLFGYQMAKECCDRRGIDVFNATIGGRLDVFPRIDFSTIFYKESP